MEFTPKTLADLNIDGISSTENGGNFSNLNRVKNSHHMYSSQQNLSNYKSNSNNNNGSTFARSKFYGSQQSLSTTSNRNNSDSHNNNKSKNSYSDDLLSISNVTATPATQSYNSNNANSRQSYDWLNAWNSPPNPHQNVNATTKPNLAPKPLNSSFNSHSVHKESHSVRFSDPWSGDLFFFFVS